MDYREVKKFVLDNSFNLEVYESVLNRGETVFRDYGTIIWTALDSGNLPKGVYVTGSHDYTGEVFRIITVQGASVRDRIVTLLHEYGHHTSYQDTTTIRKEVNAWVDCIKWMKHLDIKLTHPVKELISKCLGTYLDLLGHDDAVVEFYKEYKIPYKVSDWDSYCRLPVHLPEETLKTDYTINNEPFYKLEKWK